MRRLAVALGLALLTSAAGAADLAEVRTRGGLHADYGRLVFDWSSDVGYKVELGDGQLKVTFDRPFISSFAEAEKRLAGYIGRGRISDDGRSVVFPLRRSVSPKAFPVGQSIVVDLHHAARPGPVDTRRASPPAPLVKVRAGEHPGYTRFVFDWPKAVEYDLSGSGDDTLLAFAKPARLDTDNLTKKAVRLLDAGGADTTDIVSAVRFSVPADREVRHFRLGDRIVVDLLKRRQPVAVAAKAAADTPAKKARQGTQQAKTESRPAEPEAAATQKADPTLEPRPLPPAPVPQVVARQAPAPEPTVEAVPPTIVAEVPVAEERDLPRAFSVMPVLDRQEHRPTGTEAAAALAVPTAPVDVVPTRVLPEASQRSMPEAAAAEKSGAPQIEVGYAHNREEFSLSFPGLDDARAAAFSRAGGAWVVFDRQADLRLDRLERAAPELAAGAIVIGHSEASVLRIEDAAEHGLNVRQEGGVWVVDFRTSDPSIHRPLDVTPESASPGAGLGIAAAGAGEPIPLIDPEVGDRLVVVPLPEPGTGLAEAREYPEVQLLASAQGVAMAQRGDGLQVSTDGDRIRITTGAGLLLAREPVQSEEPATARVVETAAVVPHLLDLARWQRSDEPFAEARKRLEAAVLDSHPEALDAARLELVRFYLARGLAAEALGALEAAGPEAAASLGGPMLRAIRGAGNLLAHRLEAAKADLFHVDLDGSDEAAVWRAALHVMRGDAAKAAPLFEQGWPVVYAYPKWLRQELALRAAEAALAKGEDDQANLYLTAATAESGPHALKSRARFLEGRVLAERGDAADALAVWNTVAGGTDQLAHAKAELAAVRLGLEEGLIGREQAVERLERLRFAWRGDRIEFETLELLGRSYLAAGDHANGLATLREAVTLFAESLDTAPVTELMAQTFRRLFVDGEVRDLPPLKAVSIYHEYRELTPIGEEGDRVVRDLAARLVGLDLLEPAAELLDNQVRYRLQGERRARTAADLALIHLLDRKPAAAVEVLRMTEVPGLPQDLASRRRIMLARGLWETGSAEAALAVIAADVSREAESLRADIYWKEARWADAAQVYARMAPASGQRELAADAARTVLKWGIALTLGQDAAGARRLGARYGEAMAHGPFAAAFRMITAGPPASGESLAAITDTLAEVDDFQTYLKGYRSALEKSAAAGTPLSGSTS